MSEQKISSVLDMETLVSLMANAYSKGLKAGQESACMRDNPEFMEEAVRLFTSGLMDALSTNHYTTTEH